MIAPAAGPTRLEAPLDSSLGRPARRRAGPLSLVAIELHGTAGDNRAVGGHLDVLGLETSESVARGRRGSPEPAGGYEAVAHETSGQLTLEAGLEEAPDGVAERLGFLIGAAPDPRRLAPVTWSLRPAGVAAARTTPKVLVNGSILGATDAGLGEDTTADLGYGIVPLRLEEDLDAFPTLDPGEAIIVGDLGTVALDAYLGARHNPRAGRVVAHRRRAGGARGSPAARRRSRASIRWPRSPARPPCRPIRSRSASWARCCWASSRRPPSRPSGSPSPPPSRRASG